MCRMLPGDPPKSAPRSNRQGSTQARPQLRSVNGPPLFSHYPVTGHLDTGQLFPDLMLESVRMYARHTNFDCHISSSFCYPRCIRILKTVRRSAPHVAYECERTFDFPDSFIFAHELWDIEGPNNRETISKLCIVSYAGMEMRCVEKRSFVLVLNFNTGLGKMFSG